MDLATETARHHGFWRQGLPPYNFALGYFEDVASPLSTYSYGS